MTSPTNKRGYPQSEPYHNTRLRSASSSLLNALACGSPGLVRFNTTTDAATLRHRCGEISFSSRRISYRPVVCSELLSPFVTVGPSNSSVLILQVYHNHLLLKIRPTPINVQCSIDWSQLFLVCRINAKAPIILLLFSRPTYLKTGIGNRLTRVGLHLVLRFS